MLVGASNTTGRLLALDEVWTQGLRLTGEPVDRVALLAIGTEMRELLRSVRSIAPSLGQVILRDRKAFEVAAADVVRATPLTEDAKKRVADHFDELGWAAETEIAIRHLATSDEAEVELSRRLIELARDADPAGDFPAWMRCGMYILAAASAIGVVLATGGTPLLISVAVMGPVMHLGLDLDDWHAKNRSPSEASQMEHYLEMRGSGQWSEKKFQEEVVELLKLDPTVAFGGPKEAADHARRLEETNFSAGLERDIPAPEVIRIPNQNAKD